MKPTLIAAIALLGITLIPASPASEQIAYPFSGPVETMPAKRLGSWSIAGQQLTANGQTRFHEAECKLEVGAQARVAAHYQADQLIADQIVCELDDADDDD